jgi:cellulose synthase (UDP-forming)
VLVWLTTLLLSFGRPFLVPLEAGNPVTLSVLPEFLTFAEGGFQLWSPTVIVITLALLLRWIRPTNLTRLLVRCGMLLLVARYVVWRSLVTLNFSHWVSIVLSLLFFINELVWISSYVLYLVQSTWTTEKRRHREADHYAQAVNCGDYLPSVDVFVPTYKEPDYIVRRTVIGCLAIKYPNKTVYILDDTRRPHIRKMAEELGCQYICRPDNSHAKAGNLNHALKQTSGELITIMDADFVPFRHFLSRLAGFFQNPKTDLIQTPQHFYNPDYHARNLGLGRFLPNDMEHFFGLVQPGRDTANSVICCGTSYMVRRSSLEAVGGYYTRCCVEDYQTSIRMLTHGQRIIYLNEVLSMGESTRTFADFIDQRLRWLQGNLQVYFCGDELPVWSRLNALQKSYHVTLILFCFNPVVRLISLIVPLLSLFLGPSPVVASVSEYIYYSIPFLILYNISFTWATDYRLSAFWNEVYETAFCFPALGRLWLVLRNPFAKASTATRKGVKAETKSYNLHITWPLLVMIGLTVLGLFFHYGGYELGWWPHLQYEYEGKLFLVGWVLYNLAVMTVAVLASIDQPVRRVVDRFPLKSACKVTINGQSFWGQTSDVSESGTRVVLPAESFTARLRPLQPLKVEFLERQFAVDAELLREQAQGEQVILSLQFTNLTLSDNRHLTVWLYAEMASWKQRKRPGVLDSFIAMLGAVLKLRPVMSRY